jgi:hypothetical protein
VSGARARASGATARQRQQIVRCPASVSAGAGGALAWHFTPVAAADHLYDLKDAPPVATHVPVAIVLTTSAAPHAVSL